MVVNLDDVVGFLGIVTTVSGAVYFVVIVPLQKAMNKLGLAIEKLDENIVRHGERLAAVETSVKSAHKRIDEVIR